MKLNKMIYVSFLVLNSLAGAGYCDVHPSIETGKQTKMTTPKYLYKILSIENWKASQNKPIVQLSSEDHDFIHFSTEDQLEKIIKKYWSDIGEFVVLKVSTQKLPGKMTFEVNPGGANKYYHLYGGNIPSDAIVESKIVKP